MSTHHNRWGAKIGPRIAMLVSMAIIHTQRQLMDTKHKIAMSVFNAASDQISDEVHFSIGPILRELAEYPGLDERIKPHVEQLAYRHGQLTALAGSTLVSQGILSPIAQIINNGLNKFVLEAVGADPSGVPDTNTIANIVAKGVDTRHGTDWAMHGQGFNDSWIEDLVEAAYQYPAAADCMNLYNRGLISYGEFATYLERNSIPAALVPKYAGLAETPLSPADGALAVLRGNMPLDEAEKAAKSYGVSAHDFGILMGNTGEPLGLEQLLEAYRRGFIDKQALEKGILQSRTRNEWIPVAEQLRYSPMTISDAVNAVVQGHITMQEGVKIADENGLTPGSFDTLYQTAGEPLSRTEMEQLYNRGLASEAQVKQALLESRVKNKYVDQAFDLHQKVVPEGALANALKYGGVTQANAVRIAMESGYSKADAEMLVQSGLGERLQTYRERVVSSAQALYEANLMSASDAEKITTEMGYTSEEAQFMVKASEFHREATAIRSVVTAIRNKYLQHHITDTQASNLLDSAGIPATQRDYLIKLWKIEHGAYTKVLTEAQIVKAVKLELISADDGIARLEDMGYGKIDAGLLLAGA